jgi:hypothetical protein
VQKLQKTLLGAFLAGLLLAVAAPSAFAITPRYRAYAGCPDDPARITSCLRADTRAGHIQMGSQDVPISQVVTLSGGLDGNSVDPIATVFNTPQGGLTGNPLEVPGGLAGLTGISEFILNLITFGANRVYAQAQLVRPAQIDFGSGDLGLRMSIKVNLRNPFLISGCSIGSTTNPIRLNMTTGTTAPPAPNRPISGHGPLSAGADPADPAITLLGTIKHVDNSFAAPRSYNCDLLGFGLITGLIDSRVGLPSAAGRNEAVFDRTDLRLVASYEVYP